MTPRSGFLVMSRLCLFVSSAFGPFHARCGVSESIDGASGADARARLSAHRHRQAATDVFKA